MKKIIISVIAVYAVFAFASCASTKTTAEGGTLSLLEAIEQSAEKIASELPAGSRVAIVAFDSENANLSEFIMEEITGALVDRGIEVADRQNLAYVYQELGFQMSGDVSDETAQSVGKFLGAELVITGQLQNIGSTYRYRASMIRVEKAARASVTRLNVRNDDEMRNMVTTLASQQKVVTPARPPATTAPQTAGTFLDRGLQALGKKEYDTAIADFTEAIRINPNSAVAYYNRGRAYQDKGDNDRSISDLDQAIRLDPNYVSAYIRRGIAYYNKKDYDRAIADYDQAIRFDPNNANAYTNRGAAYRAKGDNDRAIADHDQAIRLNPNYASAYLNRGNVYYNKKDYDRAIADYEAVLRINPNHADAQRNIELARRARGR